MSTIRSPHKAVARCLVADCKWTRIYFERNQPATVNNVHFTPELRAEMGLLAHQRAKHRAKVLINGR